MELLRLAGAPGAGKSTVAWAIARRLADDGVATGYVDIDQLGMCYPAPDGDPDRWDLKERALDGVADGFRQAGVARLVVSGVARPEEPPPRSDVARTHSIWLDATEGSRRRRLAERELGDEQLQRTLAAGTAEAQHAHADWQRVATDARTVADVVGDVLAGWQDGGERGSTRIDGVGRAAETRAVDGAEAAAVDGDVLWLTGPRLAGASRVGWEVVTREWSAGRRAGFIDATQLSFAWNVPRPVGLGNLRRVLPVFHAVGAERFVVVAPLSIGPAAAARAVGTAALSFIRLDVAPADVREHALRRQRGGGPRLAGDDVLGASDADIDGILHLSAEQSLLPPREGEAVADVRGCGVVDAAAAVRAAAGWS